MAKGKLITQNHAGAVWRTFLNEGREVALRFHLREGYHVTTFYSIINQNGTYLKKKGIKPKKWSSQQINIIVNYLETNNMMTLKELLEFAENNNFPKISKTTLSNYLSSQLYTLKNISNHPIERNSPEIKNKRKLISTLILENPDFNLIFIDEFGFNLGTQRNRGRSLKGEKAINITPLSKGGNVSTVMAVEKQNGVICYDSENSPINSDDFQVFLVILCENIKEKNIRNPVLFFDNAPIHKESDIIQICEFYDMFYMYNAPYSPMLNIMEECINDIKQSIKTKLSITHRHRVLGIAAAPYGQKSRQRKALLSELLEDSIEVLTIEKVQSHYNHFQRILLSCIREEDL